MTTSVFELERPSPHFILPSTSSLRFHPHLLLLPHLLLPLLGLGRLSFILFSTLTRTSNYLPFSCISLHTDFSTLRLFVNVNVCVFICECVLATDYYYFISEKNSSITSSQRKLFFPRSSPFRVCSHLFPLDVSNCDCVYVYLCACE